MSPMKVQHMDGAPSVQSNIAHPSSRWWNDTSVHIPSSLGTRHRLLRGLKPGMWSKCTGFVFFMTCQTCGPISGWTGIEVGDGNYGRTAETPTKYHAWRQLCSLRASELKVIKAESNGDSPFLVVGSVWRRITSITLLCCVWTCLRGSWSRN